MRVKVDPWKLRATMPAQALTHAACDRSCHLKYLI